MFIKPYFRFKTSETAYNVDLNELKAPSLTLKVSQESIKPVKLKRSRGRPRKHSVTNFITENLVTENHLTFINVFIKQLLSTDILILI